MGSCIYTGQYLPPCIFIQMRHLVEIHHYKHVYVISQNFIPFSQKPVIFSSFLVLCNIRWHFQLFLFPPNIKLSKDVFFFFLWLGPVGLSCTPAGNRNHKPRSCNFKLKSWCNSPFYTICRTYIGRHCDANSLSTRVWGQWKIEIRFEITYRNWAGLNCCTMNQQFNLHSPLPVMSKRLGSFTPTVHISGSETFRTALEIT